VGSYQRREEVTQVQRFPRIIIYKYKCMSSIDYEATKMREDKTTDVKIKIEVMGKQVSLEKAVSDHELEEGVAALLNSALLLENTLNEE